MKITDKIQQNNREIFRLEAQIKEYQNKNSILEKIASNPELSQIEVEIDYGFSLDAETNVWVRFSGGSRQDIFAADLKEQANSFHFIEHYIQHDYDDETTGYFIVPYRIVSVGDIQLKILNHRPYKLYPKDLRFNSIDEIIQNVNNLEKLFEEMKSDGLSINLIEEIKNFLCIEFEIQECFDSLAEIKKNAN